MKKKIYISITTILLLALCISLCACLTGCGNSSENIKLGYTHDEVRKIMGDPYEDLSSDYTWCYLGSSYTNILNQIAKNEEAQEEALMKGDLKRLIDLANQEEELQAKLETTVYEYTEITFVRDEAKGYIVNSVMFDKNRCNAYPIDKREVKNVEVGGTIVVDEIPDKTGDTEKAIVMVNGEVGADAYYKARYTDGSYRLAYLTDVEVVEATANKAKITWSDNLATYETNADITVNEVGEIDKDGKFVTFPGFNRNKDLTSFTIPSNVTRIGKIYNCDGLESITLPFVGATLNGDENTHFGYIFDAPRSDYNASYVPDSLKEVIITGGNSIDDYAFEGCANIERITIPSSVTSIGTYAFRSCIGLKNITIPNSVTSIGDNAFEDCASLESITIPNSVTSIGNEAFEGCESLNYNQDDNADYLGNDENPYLVLVKAKNANISTCEINSNTKIISYGAFSGCENLTSVTIPSGVTGIGYEAFSSCTNLTSISIPSSVTSMGDRVFSGCTSLNYKQDDNADYLGNDTNPYLVLVKAKSVDISTCEINSKTRFIHSYAFLNRASLRSITVPNSVISIGEDTFYGCDIITSITLPFVGATLNGDKNTDFGYIFGDHVPASLKEVTITGGNSIAGGAFSGCTNLKSITIPSSVTTIGKNAFSGCDNLTIYCEAASKPNGWDSDWNSSDCPVIWDCNNNNKDEDGNDYPTIEGIKYQLKGGVATVIAQPITISGVIEIPATVIYKNQTYNVTNIDEDAFKGCTGLTNVTIPSSVTSIGSGAFESCTSLASITLPFVGATLNGDENVYFGYIFGGGVYDSNVPASLKEVIITGGNSLGEYAFSYCTRITSITIPSSVTSIGSYAFSNCGSLTTINYDGTTSGWQSISKDTWWNLNIGNYTVYCTDGTVSKDGTVTPNA